MIKKYSREEKIKILNEADINGVKKTIDKYGLYTTTFYGWKNRLLDSSDRNQFFDMKRKRLARIKFLENEVIKLQLLLDKTKAAQNLQHLNSIKSMSK